MTRPHCEAVKLAVTIKTDSHRPRELAFHGRDVDDEPPLVGGLEEVGLEAGH